MSAIENFSITNKTKGKLPSLPFHTMKEKILGKNYNLSVVFVGVKKSQELNKKYRNREEPANILTFPLEKLSGEIVINPNKAKKDASHFDMNYHEFLIYLFIHGLLHLKGRRHGSRMDNEEQTLLNVFNHVTIPLSRNRSR